MEVNNQDPGLGQSKALERDAIRPRCRATSTSPKKGEEIPERATSVKYVTLTSRGPKGREEVQRVHFQRVAFRRFRKNRVRTMRKKKNRRILSLRLQQGHRQEKAMASRLRVTQTRQGFVGEPRRRSRRMGLLVSEKKRGKDETRRRGLPTPRAGRAACRLGCGRRGKGKVGREREQRKKRGGFKRALMAKGKKKNSLRII